MNPFHPKKTNSAALRPLPAAGLSDFPKEKHRSIREPATLMRLVRIHWLKLLAGVLLITAALALPESWHARERFAVVIGPAVLIFVLLWIMTKSDRENFG